LQEGAPVQDRVDGILAARIGLGQDAPQNLALRKALGKPGAPYGGIGFFEWTEELEQTVPDSTDCHPSCLPNSADCHPCCNDFRSQTVMALKLQEFERCANGVPSIYFWVLHPIFNSKDHVVGAFMQVTGGGIICDEAWRGIRMNIDDVTLHADAIHRGAGQIMPAAKKVFYASQIASDPILYEPMYLVDITVPQPALSGVYQTLNARRGEVESMQERVGTPLVQIRAFLPVAESFGFTQLLRQKTGGQAFPQMKFDHWAKANGNPMKEGSPAYEVVMKMRKRKGLKEILPEFTDYYDRV